MPFVKEQDLFKLHQDLDHAHRDNLALLEQLRFKDHEVRKMRHQRMVMVGLSLSLMIVTLSLMAFAAGMVTQSREVTREAMQASQQSLESSRSDEASYRVKRVLTSESGDRVTAVKWGII